MRRWLQIESCDRDELIARTVCAALLMALYLLLALVGMA